MLGFFFRHYDPWIDRYVIYDDGSTDGSLEIMRAHPKVELRQLPRVDTDSFVISHTQMQEHAWKESRGQADWVVITAIDEHLWVRGMEMIRYLQGLHEAGVTCVPALGFDMHSEEFPRDSGLLIETVTCGRARRFFNKLSIFNPDAVEETRYVGGRHSAEPTGKVVFPAQDQLLLWHYKHLGFERVAARHDAQGARLGSKDRVHGWGHRYLWPRDKLAWQWRAMRATSTDLAELTDPALSCERPLWWRPEQRLSELLERQRPLHCRSGNPKQPRVSVVVKSFNHEEYIRHCIQSVLNQTFQDFELIVTDDASTDDTVAVVESFADDRIKLERLPHNLGISGAMNAAISRASGEYVAILNSDDWALPDRLERQVAFLDTNPDVGLVFGMPTFVDDRDELTNGFNDFRVPLSFPDFSRRTWLRHFFFSGNCLCAPTAMVRKKVFSRVGDYDVRLTNSQDLDYWVRALIAGFNICVLDQEVTAFRIRDKNRNMSAPRTDTLLRGDFECFQILHHFQSVDPELLGDQSEDDYPPTAARLAKLAFSTGDAVRRSFALQTLYQHADSTDDLTLLKELAGTADIHGRIAQAALSHRIGQLEAALEERQQQATQSARAQAELTQKIGDLQTTLKEYLQASTTAKAELARLLASRSWRYTEHLRYFLGVIQRGQRKLVGPLRHARNTVLRPTTITPGTQHKPLTSRRVFDCFLYSGQRAALLSRLQHLNPIVDIFVVVERASTRELMSCRRQFDPCDHQISGFASKIRYVPVKGTEVEGWKSWEHHAVWRGAPDAAASDLFILSDVTQLPSATAVAKMAADEREVLALCPNQATLSSRADRAEILVISKRELDGSSPADLRRAIQPPKPPEFFGRPTSRENQPFLLASPSRAAVGPLRCHPLHPDRLSHITNRVKATLSTPAVWRIRRIGRPKLPPVVICPYLHSQEEDEILLKFGLGNGASRHIEFFLWHDAAGIGPELAFEHCWDRFPDRDVIILHSDMAPMPGEPRTQWYDSLVELRAKLPAAGMLACNLFHSKPTASGAASVQCAGGTFTDGTIDYVRGPLDQPGGVPSRILSQIRVVDWVTFGGVLIRREVINACGGFDRRYKWAYVMDVDYSLEARLRGFQLAQVPVSLQHEESRTTGGLMQQNPELMTHMHMNFRRFYAKWQPFYPLLVDREAERQTSMPRKHSAHTTQMQQKALA